MATKVRGLSSVPAEEKEKSCFGREWTIPVSAAAMIAKTYPDRDETRQLFIVFIYIGIMLFPIVEITQIANNRCYTLLHTTGFIV